MNKIKYTIRTKYGNKYELTNKGQVVKYSNGLDKTNASEQELNTWIIMGIRELKPFGNLGSLIPLCEAINIKEFCFKNGNPKYTIQDLDHNTVRIVGNTKVHGIVSIIG